MFGSDALGFGGCKALALGQFSGLALLLGKPFRLALCFALGGGRTFTLGLLGALDGGLLGGGPFGLGPLSRPALRLGGFVIAALRLAFCLGLPRVGATPPDQPARQQAQHGCGQQPGHQFVHE